MAVNIVRRGFLAGLAGAAMLTPGVAAQQSTNVAALHAKVHKHLVIRNAMVIYGNRRPPSGPFDVVIDDGRISSVAPPGTDGSDAVIDGTGKYVMPGIVNTHMHWHEERQPGMPQPIQYERNLYLAAGVTTAREVGGDFDKSKRWQAESDAHKIVAPRILVYPVVSRGRTGSPAEIRAWIRDVKDERRRRPEDHRHGSRSGRSDPRRSAQARASDRHTHRRRRNDGEGLHRPRRGLDRALLRRGGRRA